MQGARALIYCCFVQSVPHLCASVIALLYSFAHKTACEIASFRPKYLIYQTRMQAVLSMHSTQSKRIVVEFNDKVRLLVNGIILCKDLHIHCVSIC